MSTHPFLGPAEPSARQFIVEKLRIAKMSIWIYYLFDIQTRYRIKVKWLHEYENDFMKGLIWKFSNNFSHFTFYFWV